MASRKPAPLDGKGLMEYALRALGQRAMSTSDLRSKLLRRAAERSDVDEVIARLKDPGLLNDGRFAESYAAARLENQGFGRMRVLRDLRQRRVASGIAETAVQKAFAGTDEAQLIDEYLKRKYRGKNLPEFLSEAKNLASTFRRLRNAGFSPGAAIGALKQYAAQADQLEDADEQPKEE